MLYHPFFRFFRGFSSVKKTCFQEKALPLRPENSLAMAIEITYRRTKRLSMRIVKNGDVHVSAPIGTPRDTVMRFINDNKEWIAQEHLRAAETAIRLLPPAAPADARAVQRSRRSAVGHRQAAMHPLCQADGCPPVGLCHQDDDVAMGALQCADRRDRLQRLSPFVARMVHRARRRPRAGSPHRSQSWSALPCPDGPVFPPLA